MKKVKGERGASSSHIAMQRRGNYRLFLSVAIVGNSCRAQWPPCLALSVSAEGSPKTGLPPTTAAVCPPPSPPSPHPTPPNANLIPPISVVCSPHWQLTRRQPLHRPSTMAGRLHWLLIMHVFSGLFTHNPWLAPQQARSAVAQLP